MMSNSEVSLPPVTTDKNVETNAVFGQDEHEHIQLQLDGVINEAEIRRSNLPALIELDEPEEEIEKNTSQLELFSAPKSLRSVGTSDMRLGFAFFLSAVLISILVFSAFYFIDQKTIAWSGDQAVAKAPPTSPEAEEIILLDLLRRH